MALLLSLKTTLGRTANQNRWCELGNCNDNPYNIMHWHRDL